MDIEHYFSEAAQVKIDFIKNHKADLEKIIDVIVHSLKNG